MNKQLPIPRIASFCLFAGTIVALLFCNSLALAASDDERAQIQQVDRDQPMNVVFFLVDDLGWADLGYSGSQFHETPNIDRLAASGMQFTNGYAACPVCSPTRASIMTGRHPVRVDITDWIPGRRHDPERGDRFKDVPDRDNLALEEVTIAEVLKDVGYQTFFAGKWHLGGEGFLPTDQGFDFNIGGCDRGSPPGGYYAPWTNPHLTANHEDEYLTERLTEESLTFLNDRDPSQPFLLYLSYYNVHTPITPYRKTIEHFRERAETLFGDSESAPITEHDGRSRTRQDNAEYASMIAAVDESVGSILDRLEEIGIDDQTVVVFFSDNGGLCTLNRVGPTTNLPLRAGKGWLYEGGVREPMIIRAPGIAEPGSQCDTPVVSMDFFPTLLELAGLETQPNLHRDGVSLVPLLRNEAFEPRTFYWHYPHYHGSTWKPGASIREGDWKLIEFYHYEKVELYHLGDDPGEQVDLAEDRPEVRDRLLGKLHQWQSDLNARMPELY